MHNRVDSNRRDGQGRKALEGGTLQHQAGSAVQPRVTTLARMHALQCHIQSNIGKGDAVCSINKERTEDGAECLPHITGVCQVTSSRKDIANAGQVSQGSECVGPGCLVIVGRGVCRCGR
jgi:hypothetical protein